MPKIILRKRLNRLRHYVQKPMKWTWQLSLFLMLHCLSLLAVGIAMYVKYEQFENRPIYVLTGLLTGWMVNINIFGLILPMFDLIQRYQKFLKFKFKQKQTMEFNTNKPTSVAFSNDNGWCVWRLAWYATVLLQVLLVFYTFQRFSNSVVVLNDFLPNQQFSGKP